MFNRRMFLSHATTTLLLIPIVAVAACGGGSSPNGENTGCPGVDTVSTVVDAHTHSVCVLTSDLTAPPAAGATYTSTTALGHSHTITLTAAQLSSINSGQSVTVTSSSVEGHTHDFAIVKA
jgi:hypothetical protein